MSPGFTRPRPRPASATQRGWAGKTSRSPESREARPVGRACLVEACGTAAAGPRPAPRMVLVELSGSREPARWYCKGACAVYGQALAEVRALPVGGER
ncbi:hypothetical protein [Streptomyces sp. NPDC095602]|uniref:hypothetical protein n=1 Tax=Streptomyces sp. NPDC095602 TaxID=3155819 RepID=UPI00332752F4